MGVIFADRKLNRRLQAILHRQTQARNHVEPFMPTIVIMSLSAIGMAYVYFHYEEQRELLRTGTEKLRNYSS